jgi:AcrR family transcriptional regulator
LRSRERWLHEGLEILAESGIRGVTIESLAARLGLSKGSFYHHFDGMPGYRRALLSYFEQRESQDFIERANTAPEPAGEPRLRHMVADVMAAEGGRPRLENAVRSWASGDPAAREYLDRIDDGRVDFLQTQFEAMGLDQQAAADFSRLAHLASVGAVHVVPPLAPAEIVRLWDRLLFAATSSAVPSDARGAVPVSR